MLETYQDVLRDNRIEWSGDVPEKLPRDQAVRVHVTLLDKVGEASATCGQGRRMAEALERLAAGHALEDIPDPAAWERDLRQDRPLPDREA